MAPRWLSYVVIAAAAFAVCGLLYTLRISREFAPRRNFAPAKGSERAGIRYALFAGMMPWAKESASQHLLTYFTGILYHFGIAAAFIVLIATLVSYEVSGSAVTVLIAVTLVGAVAGIGLLVKREVNRTLRSISTPDDFLSNGLVTIFLVVAAATLWKPEFSAAFLIIATMLFLYIPAGKIRHCLLFFSSRVTFGSFFGRRDVLPHHNGAKEESHVSQ